MLTITKTPRKVAKAHRVAYDLLVGEIPAGMHVLHRCDHPWCVNPEHLFLGTHQDNVADMVAKGRNRPGSGHGMRGELHPTAVLTEAQAMSAREQYAAGRSQVAIAADLGVSQTVISAIVRGVAWAHLGSAVSRPIDSRAGAGNGRAKVTEEEVRAIRQRWSDGETQEQIAQEFGLKQVTVSKIVRRESWRHI